MDYTYRYTQLKSGKTIKIPQSVELSPGEQLILIKENLKRARKFKLDQMTRIAEENGEYNIH